VLARSLAGKPVFIPYKEKKKTWTAKFLLSCAL